MSYIAQQYGWTIELIDNHIDFSVIEQVPEGGSARNECLRKSRRFYRWNQRKLSVL